MVGIAGVTMYVWSWLAGRNTVGVGNRLDKGLTMTQDHRLYTMRACTNSVCRPAAVLAVSG